MVLLLPSFSDGQFPSTGVSGAVQHGTPRTLHEKLQSTILDFDTSGKPMANLALELAYKYNLPMGIEYVTPVAVRGHVSLRFKRRSLREIIITIVEAVPGFRVDLSGGVVDIYSPQARHDPSNPFNVTVHSINISNVDTHLADAELLCSLARQLTPNTACGGSVAPGQWGDLRITLHLQDKKVYEVLNAIVAQNGRAVWTPTYPLPAKLGRNLTNFWYIYPLDASFETTAFERVESLFPRPAMGESH